MEDTETFREIAAQQIVQADTRTARHLSQALGGKVTDQCVSFELDSSKEQVFIHGSAEALRAFARRLDAIAEHTERTGHSHDHLATEEWAGNELSSDLQGGTMGHVLVNQVNVYGWAPPNNSSKRTR